MGGKLEVESEPDKGSRFFFSLNLPSAKNDVQETDDRLDKVLSLAEGHSVSSVLIDDNRNNLNVLAETLQEIGVETTVAESGLEGLEEIRKAIPDIVFVDYQMPGMDGLEVTKRINNTYRDDKIKIVMISASTFDHHREQYMNEGVHGFVGKPFIREEILGIMARLLNVEFEYSDEIAPVEQASVKELNFSQIVLPEEILKSIKEMASMGMMDELEEILPQIESSGPDGPELAACLQNMVDQFNMDGIIEILDKIGSD